MRIAALNLANLRAIETVEFGAVFVLMKHVHPISFGVAKTAAIKVLGG